MPDLVPYTVTDRVALITVNDPDRRNAVTDAMSGALRAAIERAEAMTACTPSSLPVQAKRFAPEPIWAPSAPA